MIQVPAHKQTDTSKRPGVIRHGNVIRIFPFKKTKFLPVIVGLDPSLAPNLKRWLLNVH